MNNLIRPLPDVYPISSNFGLRRHPIHNINGWHNGVDIAAPNGTNIRSAGDGEVIWEGNNESYGNMIVVEHPDGKLSLYAHMQETNVKTGDKVKTGDSIGKVGNTGHSKGNHLHYEVIDGNRQDNGIKIKDRIKWTNNFKYGINSKNLLVLGHLFREKTRKIILINDTIFGEQCKTIKCVHLMLNLKDRYLAMMINYFPLKIIIVVVGRRRLVTKKH
ncbi:MAG: M23 family metallopeptidase [Rickettsiales bacterium]|nr:M23 family metallopeptidase [Rickettsiales bacterium]